MRAKFVYSFLNEKFVEESDPIGDMGIGIRKLWKNIQSEWMKGEPTCHSIYNDHIRKFLGPYDENTNMGPIVRIPYHTIRKLLEDPSLSPQNAFEIVCNEEIYDKKWSEKDITITKELSAKVLKKIFLVDIDPKTNV